MAYQCEHCGGVQHSDRSTHCPKCGDLICISCLLTDECDADGPTYEEIAREAEAVAERRAAGDPHEQTARFEISVTENQDTGGIKTQMKAYPEWLHGAVEIDGTQITTGQYFVRVLAQRMGNVLAEFDKQIRDEEPISANEPGVNLFNRRDAFYQDFFRRKGKGE